MDGAQIIAEYDVASGSLTKKYIYGPGIDRPVAMINVDAYGAETWYYYYADALGSVRLMTNASGAVVESYTYDVYGQPYVMTAAGTDGNWLTEDVSTQNSSGIGNPYMFTGRRWDAETGLYYYRMRDYSPQLGRFCQTDPLGYIDTMNLYAYCANNPLNWIDPWGLKTYLVFQGKDKGAVMKRGVAFQIKQIKKRSDYDPASDKISVVGDNEALTPASMAAALQNNKDIAMVVYVGHGGPRALYLDPYQKGSETYLLTDYYNGTDFQGGRVGDLPAGNLAPGCEIYLYSCSPAAGKNTIAQNMATHFGVAVYASDEGVSFGRFGIGGEPRSVSKTRSEGKGFHWVEP